MRATFFADQIDVAFRGVNRIEYATSSIDRRTPSIHPKHSASSTDWFHVIDGLPLPTL